MGDGNFSAIEGSKYGAIDQHTRIGSANPDEMVEAWVSLRHRAAIPAPTALAEMAKLPPNRREYLDFKEFEALYGADPEDVSRVVAYVEKSNIRVTGIKPAQRAIYLEGSVKDFNLAFNIEMAIFKMSFSDVYRSYEGELYIPEELKGIITGVFGLHNHVPVRSKFKQINHLKESIIALKKKNDLPAVGAAEGIGGLLKEAFNCIDLPEASPNKMIALSELKDAPVDEILKILGDILCEIAHPLYPAQLGRLYQFPECAQGCEGESIALIELGGGYKRSSLEKYFSPEYSGAKMPEIVDVSVNGGLNTPGESFIYDAEVYLDIEVAGSVAGGAGIVVYFAPDESNSSYISALRQAVHDEKYNNSVISTSWGDCENPGMCPMEMTAFNETFIEAMLKGITVVAASGDNGSSDGSKDGKCHVDFPASNPYVLGCGGTSIKISDGVITSEAVWNCNWIPSLLIASGGGVSDIYEVPFYQSDAGIKPVSANAEGNTGRGVPDVAAAAAMFPGYKVLIGEMLTPIGGTSAAAPLWAALVALMNHHLKTRLGFIHPILYSIFQTQEVFRDITEGNNGAYRAEPGWDPCTGLGSPIGNRLLEAIRDYINHFE